jgi:alpha-glucoside transport system substrate-binding protein
VCARIRPGEDAKFNWANFEDLKKVDLKGETLAIFGPWRGPDEALFQSVLEYFREATGATVNYSSSENYEQQIVIDTQAGSPPNIAILPQPGLIQTRLQGLAHAALGATATFVKDNYGAGRLGSKLGTYKDKDGTEKFFAFPYKADLKSLVWYSPENFEDAGYKVPGPGRAEGCPTRSSPMAARRGASGSARAARPAGRRPTGSKTSCCAPRRRNSTTSGRPTRSRSTIRPSSNAIDNSAGSPPTTDGRWRRAAVSRDRLPRQPEGSLRPRRRSATCTARPRSSRPSSRKAKLGEDADFFYLPPMAAKRISASRCSARHAVHDHQGLEGRARLHRVPEDADRA